MILGCVQVYSWPGIMTRYRSSAESLSMGAVLAMKIDFLMRQSVIKDVEVRFFCFCSNTPAWFRSDAIFINFTRETTSAE